MDKNNALSKIFGFIFLSIFTYLVWIFISYFIKSLSTIDPKISASIIGGMVTVLMGIGAIILNHRNTKLREIEEAYRNKKVEIYENYLNIVSAMHGGNNEKLSIQAPTEQELIDELFKFKREIILWGSPKIIKAQLEFEEKSNLGTKEVLIAMNNIYLAIREDIGLSNSGLNNYEIMKMHLSDPKELDKAIK